MTRAELYTLEHLGALAVVLDQQGAVVEWTRRFEQSIACDPLELRGRRFCELVAGTDAEVLRCVLAEVASDHSPRCVEAALMLASGEPRTVAWTCSAIADNAIIAHGVDITNTRKARDSASHRVLSLHSQVLMSMAEGVSFIDHDGIIRFTNPALDAMFGYAAGELVGQHVTVLNDATPEENERIVADIERVLASGASWHGEFRDRRKDGSVFYTSANISTLYLPDGLCWVSVQEDITVRRRTEQELIAREGELSAIYANVPGILFYVSIDRDGEFRFASINREFLEVTGLTRDDIIGKRVRDVIPSPSRDMVLANYREAIRTRQTVRWEELSRYPAGLRYGEVAVTPLYDASSAAIGLIGIVHDLTARKQAEDALRDGDARKSEFLATLSHELRNPLTPIRNALSILDREPLASETALRMRKILGRQVNHLVRIVDDLMDIERISHTQILLRCEQLELGELVANTIEDHRSGFDTCGITLELDRVAEPLRAVGDATRLVQVLGNLLGNAMKFTPRGGRTSVSLVRAGDFAELRVRDNGIGIEREVLEQLFTPFTQARQPLDRTPGGLGLGLAVVKRLVELHGGSVAAASDGPGTGTELTVRLPLGELPPPEEPTARPRSLVRRRILVIEDNRDAAETLQHMLESNGHEVRVAYDGATGLAAGREFLPEVVFCDLGLPGMSGYDVCRAFRADGALARVVLVALSGYTQPGDRERAATSGFTYHVAKPPTSHDLQRAIDAVPRSE